mmetsp:Transcript_24162/g.56169  ORF Transcript_24162/g.56169 Transcript_24162/m.56169 type:complete len:195 (+) Transcript_24162:111-695(+)|eukprot:CAMPEP_0178428486 /NCGR_PEP_ID=MMETSP0689_2-20121128/30304_1 /TAXON_ID=160604 /ORGANISM="Amphidinium massartii, Strain CS-259" /LENGTH=194 /DNA_ID=CAMNT_0020050263 /DNA_START=42 /DNA_END=626 /DNA_ORIENTATION=-
MVLTLAAVATGAGLCGGVAGAITGRICGARAGSGRSPKIAKQVKVEGVGNVKVHTQVKRKKTFITLDTEAMLGVSDLPFCSAVACPDGTIYVSGVVAAQRASDGSPEIVPGGPEAETKKILEVIDACLRACGATMDDITIVNAFLVDYTDERFAVMNRGYMRFWGNRKLPARICTGTDRVGLGGNVEFSCIARV